MIGVMCLSTEIILYLVVVVKRRRRNKSNRITKRIKMKNKEKGKIKKHAIEENKKEKEKRN
jgi:hypothetical protein